MTLNVSSSKTTGATSDGSNESAWHTKGAARYVNADGVVQRSPGLADLLSANPG